MQTFLPYADFERSAAVLDWRRLGKQRVEAYQIYLVLTEGRKPWSNHPAVRMWRGFEAALALYHDVVITEWVRRGYRNRMAYLLPIGPVKLPDWFGCSDFHCSHRSNLLRKQPEHYRKFFPDVPDNLPYVWPV